MKILELVIIVATGVIIGSASGIIVGNYVFEQPFERKCVKGKILLTNGTAAVWKLMDDGSQIRCTKGESL